MAREASLGVAPNGEPVMRELERRVLLSVMDRQWREHLYEMDYLQEGIGLRAMGQRDPLVEYQREGFDMFKAMMEAIKEEAVGFLFNVEVQTATPTLPPAAAHLVATGPGEGPGEVLAEPLLADAPAAPAPVPASEQQAPAPAVEQASPAAPQPVPDDEPAAAAVLPDDFGRPERPAQLQYSGPAYDAAPGSTGVATTVDGVERTPEGVQSRNDLCACGSGRKYKRCHGSTGE